MQDCKFHMKTNFSENSNMPDIFFFLKIRVILAFPKNRDLKNNNNKKKKNYDIKINLPLQKTKPIHNFL